MLRLRRFTELSLKRLLSTSNNNVLEHLKDRTLIRVSGAEVANFLQGLITNDIEHLSTGPGSMYTMFLNTQGRILYDAIIYRYIEKDTYLVECDSQVSQVLQKHLKLYRVRRKIDVTSLGDELRIYALFNNSVIIQEKINGNAKIVDELSSSQKLNKSSQTTGKIHHDLLVYRDPRIFMLGSRIIAKTDVNVHQIVNVKTNSDNKNNYRWLRYSLGVGEGIQDLPPGDCFPLECNCDYLHGVSFHKGCYVGQELTARVHHTGMVRKRLMPIHFTKQPSKIPDEKIVHENVSLGKFRGIENNAGLGLLRIEKALAFKEIKLGDGIGVTCKPSWWPAEAPKEKINVSKAQ